MNTDIILVALLAFLIAVVLCRNVKDETFAYNDTTRPIITSVKEIKPLERGKIVFLMTNDSVPNHV